MTDTSLPASYPVSDRMRVKRMPDRGHYDRKTVHAILDAGFLCHVGYVIDGQPYVTPTAYWRSGERVFWHGSSASRMIRAQQEGIPVCFTVALLDGLVLARSGFHHSINYRSVMATGTARLLTDREEKLAALRAFMDRIGPPRWNETRAPDEQELKATKVLAMDLADVAAKIRTGPPVDDEADYALPCWAGVVPAATVWGTPIPDPRLRAGIALPDYLKNFTLGR